MVLYSSADALPLFSDVIVQSRISPGFTTVDLSNAIIFESRSTLPANWTLTSGRAAFASMKCLCAKPATPASIKIIDAVTTTLSLFLDFNIVFVSLGRSGKYLRCEMGAFSLRHGCFLPFARYGDCVGVQSAAAHLTITVPRRAASISVSSN